MDNVTITSAQYVAFDGDNISIDATIDGIEMHVSQSRSCVSPPCSTSNDDTKQQVDEAGHLHYSASAMVKVPAATCRMISS